MILLDENIRQDQRELPRGWRIQFRQIGKEIPLAGIADENIIPLLHALDRPAFFTQDRDFFKQRLCHANYALVFVDAPANHVAEHIRSFLKHRFFDTKRKRMGVAAHIQPSQVQFWRKGERRLQTVGIERQTRG